MQSPRAVGSDDGAMAASLSADAAAAVALVRHEVGSLLAGAVGPAPSLQTSSRLASALHSVQTTCGVLDEVLPPNGMPSAFVKADTSLERLCATWVDHVSRPMQGAATTESSVPVLIPDSHATSEGLLQHAEALTPQWLRTRPQAALVLSARSTRDAPLLELKVDGAFRALVSVRAAVGTPSAEERRAGFQCG